MSVTGNEDSYQQEIIIFPLQFEKSVWTPLGKDRLSCFICTSYHPVNMYCLVHISKGVKFNETVTPANSFMYSVGKNIAKRQRNTVKSDRTTKL